MFLTPFDFKIGHLNTMKFTSNIKVDIPDLKVNTTHLNQMAQENAVQFISARKYFDVTTLQARSLRSENTLLGAKIFLENNEHFLTKVSNHILEDF